MSTAQTHIVINAEALCGSTNRDDDYEALTPKRATHATCEKCLMTLGWAGIYAMEQLAAVLRGTP